MSAVPKSCGQRDEILGCRAHFSARVNGALVGKYSKYNII